MVKEIHVQACLEGATEHLGPAEEPFHLPSVDPVQNVEESIQFYAGVKAVDISPDKIEYLQDVQDATGLDYNDVDHVNFFTDNGGFVLKSVDDVTLASVNVGSFFVEATTLYEDGQAGEFYYTGPTANPCFFIEDQQEREQCIVDNGG